MISLVLLEVTPKVTPETKYISIALQVIALTVIVGTIVYNTLKFIRDTKAIASQERRKKQESFESLVSSLTSDNIAAQLSAAILLRKFFDVTDKLHQ